MNISYNDKTDLLYIRLNDARHDVINKRIDDDITLDVAAKDQIVGIEILNASHHLRLESLLPVNFSDTRSKIARRAA